MIATGGTRTATGGDIAVAAGAAGSEQTVHTKVIPVTRTTPLGVVDPVFDNGRSGYGREQGDRGSRERSRDQRKRDPPETKYDLSKLKKGVRHGRHLVRK